MSFVGPPFEHDVFFSYAHADVDRVGDAETKAWCQHFAKDLRQALRRFPEFALLSLYLDESPRESERLDETAELTPALRAAAGSSALLCAMMSPWYLKSEWCTKERHWWDKGTRALAPPIASGFDRAFICRLMDTIEDEWPEIFKDVEDIVKKGFWLYDRAKPKHERVPWGWIGSEEDKAAYKKCVIEVPGRIGRRCVRIARGGLSFTASGPPRACSAAPRRAAGWPAQAAEEFAASYPIRACLAYHASRARRGERGGRAGGVRLMFLAPLRRSPAGGVPARPGDMTFFGGQSLHDPG